MFPHLERRDESVISVQVRYYLKPTAQRNDLALDVFLQNPSSTVEKVSDKRF